MSSISNPHPEPTAGDELVGYLDGELAPDDCRRVEERLATDATYRLQLRELDQAWEALNALPKTTVDDGFARTTIELACLAAQEDLSHHSARASVEARRQARWWLAAATAAALVGFITIYTLRVSRDNALLADLPVIEQVNVLAHVENIEFLRQLSAEVPVEQLVKDELAFDRDLSEFKGASSSPPNARRAWVNSLSAEQKAELATRAREFGNLRHIPDEQERLRKLSAEIASAPDAPKLQKTLVAYGQWLSRHTAGEQEQLRDGIRGLMTNEQVDRIQELVRRDDEQAARHLSANDAKILREEIFKLAEEKKAEFMERASRTRDGNRSWNMEGSQVRQALWILHRALQDEDSDDKTAKRLVQNLSPEAKAHWDRLGRWRRELRKLQLWQWTHDALQPKWGREDLERFFESDKLTNDERQRLLDMERPKMEATLERLYLSSELGFDDRGQWLRGFGEPGRMPRNVPGVGPGAPGRPELRREGQPSDRRGASAGPPPPNRFDRDRPPGPDGRRGPRPENGPDGGRPLFQPRRPPPDGPPPGGPPPPPEERREAI